MSKVNMKVMQPWITKTIIGLIGIEDELVINYAFQLLEQKSPDPRDMQIQLTGFLVLTLPIFLYVL
jgi:serine/arginine repetitive matrix protein 1